VIEETLFEAEEKMERAVDFAKDEFAAIRTGRATPAMFSRIVSTTTGRRRHCRNWRRSPSRSPAWS
jgi:ribosome recycling factor